MVSEVFDTISVREKIGRERQGSLHLPIFRRSLQYQNPLKNVAVSMDYYQNRMKNLLRFCPTSNASKKVSSISLFVITFFVMDFLRPRVHQLGMRLRLGLK